MLTQHNNYILERHILLSYCRNETVYIDIKLLLILLYSNTFYYNPQTMKFKYYQPIKMMSVIHQMFFLLKSVTVAVHVKMRSDI
jgi:hypothetical protein